MNNASKQSGNISFMQRVLDALKRAMDDAADPVDSEEWFTDLIRDDELHMELFLAKFLFSHFKRQLTNLGKVLKISDNAYKVAPPDVRLALPPIKRKIPQKLLPSLTQEQSKHMDSEIRKCITAKEKVSYALLLMEVRSIS